MDTKELRWTSNNFGGLRCPQILKFLKFSKIKNKIRWTSIYFGIHRMTSTNIETIRCPPNVKFLKKVRSGQTSLVIDVHRS